MKHVVAAWCQGWLLFVRLFFVLLEWSQARQAAFYKPLRARRNHFILSAPLDRNPNNVPPWGALPMWPLVLVEQ